MGLTDRITSIGSDILHAGEQVVTGAEKLAGEGITLLGQAKDTAISLVSTTLDQTSKIAGSILLTGTISPKDFVVKDSALVDKKTGDQFKVSKDSVLADLPGLEGFQRVNDFQSTLLKSVSTKTDTRANAADAGQTVKGNQVDAVLPQGKIDKNGIEFQAAGDKTGVEVKGDTKIKTDDDGTKTTRTDSEIRIDHKNGATVVKDLIHGGVHFEFKGTTTYERDGKTQVWAAGGQRFESTEAGIYKGTDGKGKLSTIFRMINGKMEARQVIGDFTLVQSEGTLNDTTPTIVTTSKQVVTGVDGAKVVVDNLSSGMTDNGNAFVQIDDKSTLLYRKDLNKIFLGVQGQLAQEIDVDNVKDEKVAKAVQILKGLVDNKEETIVLPSGVTLSLVDGHVVARVQVSRADATDALPAATQQDNQAPIGLAGSTLAMSFDKVITLFSGAKTDATAEQKDQPAATTTTTTPLPTDAESKLLVTVTGSKAGSTMTVGDLQVHQDFGTRKAEERQISTDKQIIEFDYAQNKVTTEHVITTAQGTVDRHSNDVITPNLEIKSRNVFVARDGEATFADGTKFGADGSVTLADGRVLGNSQASEQAIQQAAAALNNADSVADKVARKASGGAVTLDDIVELESSLQSVMGLMAQFASSPEIIARLMKTSAQLQSTIGQARESFAKNTALRAMKAPAAAAPNFYQQSGTNQFSFLKQAA
jgi:hypothetical protein